MMAFFQRNPRQREEGAPSPLWRQLLGYDAPQSPKLRNAAWVWAVCLMLGCALAVGLLSLYFAAGEFRIILFKSYFKVPLLVLLNLLPPVLLGLFFWFLTGRVWGSALAGGGIVMAFTMVNVLKISLRSDPLLMEDVALFTEALNQVQDNYTLSLSRGKVMGIALWAAAVIACVLLCRTRLRPWRVRLIGAGACVLAGAVLFLTVYQSPAVYADTANDEHINIWSDVQVYQSRGFVYPFLYSATYMKDDPPQGYQESAAAAALSAYEDSDIPADKQVNVIGIMLEAYCDLSRFPALSEEPRVLEAYEAYHALEAEGYSGQLLTNIFAGGTINSERSFLTGYTELGTFRVPTNSYVWYFRDQGYTVEGSHPGYDWFYNRLNVNENLGLEHYYFAENYYADLVDTVWAATRSDEILFPEILSMYQANKETGKPYFSFSVTYQNHGPYETGATLWEEYLPASSGYSQETRNIVNNYLAGIENTNQALSALVEELRADPDPVVLVVFGDHKPWLGDGNSAYTELGVTFDLDTQEGFEEYYSTRYLIWANDAAKAVTGNDFSGEGPAIGPYFLMNELFSLCSWEGNAFMKAANALREYTAMAHVSGRFWVDGTLTDTLSPQGQEVWEQFQNIQYYWRKNFAG